MADEAASEVYPLPSFPTLSTSNLEESVRFYVDGLGFGNVYTIPGPGGAPVVVHIRWCKYADLLLASEPGERGNALGERGCGLRLTFSLTLAGRTADDIARRASRLGALVEGPVERPWNARDVVVRDPDGYLLVFTEPLDMEKTMDEVLANLAGGV